MKITLQMKKLLSLQFDFNRLVVFTTGMRLENVKKTFCQVNQDTSLLTSLSRSRNHTKIIASH